MQNFINDIAGLKLLFSRKDSIKFSLLLCLMIVAAILEAIGVAAIPLFVSLIMKPSTLSSNQFIGHFFTDLPNQISTKILLIASTTLLSFIVTKNIFLAFVFYIQASIITSQRVKLGNQMFRTYQDAPFEWLLQRSSADLIRSIQHDTSQVLGSVLTPILNLVMALLMSSFLVVVLVISTPGVTLLALLVTISGLFVTVRLFQKRLRVIGKIMWRENKEMIQSIQQGFGSLIDSRILQSENYLTNKYLSSLKRSSDAQKNQQIIQKLTPYALETFTVAGLLVVLFVLIYGENSLSAILPTIALLGVVMIRLKQLSGQIASSVNQISVGRSYIPAIIEDICELRKLRCESQSIERSGHLIKSFKKLQLKNVCYAYPGANKPAIEEVSLEINKGEVVAFVGKTGCGKSTLVNVILGLLEQQRGEVLVNGVDIREDLHGWRSHLGYIQQTVYLLDDSIRGNVAFGIPKKEVDEDKLLNALNTARLEFLGRNDPNGLDTIVGERGVRLSGGQRQRLGIARALYNDSELLVMDEATSALDNRTESEVMQAIQNIRKEKTLIVIAHRLSTIRDCDRIYLLEEGRVRNVGSYTELHDTSSLFRDLTLNSPH